MSNYRQKAVCASTLVFCLLATSVLADVGHVNDAGIRALVAAQKTGQIVAAASGESPVDALRVFAGRIGIAVDDNGNEKTASRIASSSFRGSPSSSSFFLQRESAFKKCYDDSEGLLGGVPVLLAQSEGVIAGGEYQVAYLACRGGVFSAVWQDLANGKDVRLDCKGIALAEWARMNSLGICGPWIVIADDGRIHVAGATARSINGGSSAMFRKAKGASALFSRQLALRPVLGSRFFDVKVMGMSTIFGSVMEKESLGGKFYQAISAYPATQVASLGSQVVAWEKAREEARILAEKKAAEEAAKAEKLAAEKKAAEEAAKAEKLAAEKKAEEEAAKAEKLAAEKKTAEKAAKAKKFAAEKKPETDIEICEAELKSLCAKQGWCIGWDTANARIVQVGSHEFECSSPMNDGDFFMKRETALKAAIAEGLLKIACQLSFKVRVSSSGKKVIPISGATVLWMTERFNPAAGRFCVSVVVTWSKKLEELAKSISTGVECPVPAGKRTLQEWLDERNFTTLTGPRVYFDSKGNGWIVATSTYRWRSGMMPNERVKTADWVEKFIREMLSLGSYAELEVDEASYASLLSKFRDLTKENDINALLKSTSISLNIPTDKLKGQRQVNEENMHVVYPLTKENVRAAVWVLNAKLVKNAR